MNKRIIISNQSNYEDCHLENYQEGAREDALTDIDMKMVDFMKSCNTEYNILNAIDCFGVKISYNTLFKYIEMYARAFLYYGIESGDRVAVMLPNSPEMIYIQFALNTINASFVPIPNNIDQNSLLNYINTSKSKILISSLDRYKPVVEPVIDKLKVEDIYTVSPLQSVGLDYIGNMKSETSRLKMTTLHYIYEYKKMLLRIRESIKNTSRSKDISILLKNEDRYYWDINAPYIPEFEASVLSTSGLTDSIKGRIMCNEAYNSLYKNLKYSISKQTPGEKVYSMIPYYSSYGNGLGMFNSMCNRMEQYLYPFSDNSDLLKNVKKDKPNILITVPHYCEKLVDSKEKFNSLQRIIISEDKIDTSKVERFRDFFNGKQVLVSYSGAEFLGVISVTQYENVKSNSSGVPLPSVKVKIVDPKTMKELPYFTSGEAYIHNISMMLEYMDNCLETEKITAYDEDGNKYYGTGDKMYMTPEGQLCFVDRYERLMERPDGYQINANPIEETISKLDGVKRCCVLGLKYKEENGVIPTAFVELENKSSKLNEYVNLFEEASEKGPISLKEKALAYVFIDKMPILSCGRIDTNTLSKLKLDEIKEAIIVDNPFIKPKESKSYKRLYIK